ncbi:MAG: hypothetical protein J6A97_05110 [Clostridia bacterium]|nr:hypothetical protein [Clostridia bacterium]
MKKLIAVVLTIVMVFSLTANVYAASITDKTDELVDTITGNTQTTQKALFSIAGLTLKLIGKAQPVIMNFLLDSENWEKAADIIMSVVVKVFDKITGNGGTEKPDEPDAPDSPDEPGDPDLPELPQLPDFSELLANLTIGDIVELISKYFFINIQDIPAASDDIIANAEYKYVLSEDGKETVFIAVNIEEHPELLNRSLLMEVTEKLYNEQKSLYPDIADEDMMSYEHIAGELALHAILYAVSNEYLSVTGETEGTIFDLWQRARIADLNITEDRIPGEIILIAGTYIMGVFIIDLYTIFNIFR